MRPIILSLALIALPASAAPKAAPEPSVVQIPDPMVRPLSDTCKRPDVHQAETPKPAKSSKLGELPPGDLILSVYNQVDGCMEPVIVRYGDGRSPGAAPAQELVRPRARVWR
ncbi:MAG TPA: hypothetical protein VGB70_08655 [Allosphingosinicella sp.]|jgi:hypothetical protein